MEHFDVKIKKINVLSMIVTFSMAMSFVYKIEEVKFDYKFKYMINSFVLLIGIYQYFYCRDKKLRKISKFIVNKGSIPYIGASLYTILLFFISNVSFSVMTRSVSTVFQMILTYMLSASLLMIFKRDAIKIWYNSLVLSYIITTVVALKNIGISGFVEHLFNPLNSQYTSWFEMHDLVISCGLMILYFIFGETKENKNNVKKILVLAFIMYCGYKRIAFLAIVIATLIGFSVRKRYNILQYWKMANISLILLAICFLYTWAVSTGVFADIIIHYNIDTMGRVNFYNYFKSFYKFSITYMGQGYGFVEKHLSSIMFSHIRGVSGVAALHNDVLRIFIELGFIGFIAWFFYYLYGIPYLIKKSFSYDGLRIYYVLISYAFITYLTDNTSVYYIFQSTWMFILGTEIWNTYEKSS